MNTTQAVETSIINWILITSSINDQINSGSENNTIQEIRNYKEFFRISETAFEILRGRLISINNTTLLNRALMTLPRVFSLGGAGILLGQKYNERIGKDNGGSSSGILKQLDKLCRSPELKIVAVASVIFGTTKEVYRFLKKQILWIN